MALTQVQSELIATNAISGTVIADNAITSVHIAQNAILTQHIDDGQVNTDQLAADAVTGAKLADSSVVTANIQDDQVTGDKLADNIQIAGTLGVTGVISPTTHIDMPDSAYFKLGTGDDLELFHTGSNSVLHNKTGQLRVRADSLAIQSYGNEDNYIVAAADGAVTLYYDNAAKLATASDGVDITGPNLDLTADDARLLVEEADGTNIGWYGDITGGGVGGCFLYNHGGTATVQLRADATAGFINNGANFGIGTDSPARNLTLSSSGQTDLAIVAGTTASAQLQFGDSGDDNIGQIEYNNSTNDMKFSTNATERMCILDTGEVGIGTMSPDAKLELEFAEGNHTTGAAITNSQAGGYGSALSFISERSDNNAHTVAARIRTEGGDSWNTDASTDSSLKLETVSANTLATKMTILHSGLTGIGTTSPQTILHVNQTNNSTGNLYTAVGAGNVPSVTVQNASTTDDVNAAVFFRDNADMRASIGCRFVSHASGDQKTQLRFSTCGSGNTRERMTLSEDGYLGVGTDAPKGHLHAHGASGDGYIVVTGDGNPLKGGKIIGHDGGITFQVNTGSNSTYSERARIDTAGRFLIGTGATGYPDGKLHAWTNTAEQYAASFRHDGGATTSYGVGIICGTDNGSGTNILLNFQDGDGSGVGTVSFSGSTTSYNTSSDERLKNITGDAKGLEIINELNPVNFTWKKGGQKGIGLIAQEAMEHVPSAVIENPETGYYQMDYSKLVTPLIKAVQELSAEVEELKKK